jgi:hypothetical protein
MMIACRCLTTGFRADLRANGAGATVTWKTRTLLYLGANYIVWLDWTARNGSGPLLSELLLPLYILVFAVVLFGILTAVATVVDRFVLAHNKSMLATPLMLILAPWPAWLVPQYDGDGFRHQLAAQLLFGFTVSLLEFQRRRDAAHRPNS